MPGTSRPDPNEMTDFNILTLNAKAYPGTAPIVVQQGDRVRLRIGNLSAMDHHPIHFHGHYWWVTETDGGVIPESARAGRKRPCSCRSEARGRSSSSPTIRAIGHCTAT